MGSATKEPAQSLRGEKRAKLKAKKAEKVKASAEFVSTEEEYMAGNSTKEGPARQRKRGAPKAEKMASKIGAMLQPGRAKNSTAI